MSKGFLIRIFRLLFTSPASTLNLNYSKQSVGSSSSTINCSARSASAAYPSNIRDRFGASTISPGTVGAVPYNWSDGPMICHSFVIDGRIQFLGNCMHKLAGQTVDLPDWEDEE